MSLYVVVGKNPLYPIGTCFDCEDGYCERVKTAQGSDGRLDVGAFVGVTIPFTNIEPFSIKVMKRGLDPSIQEKIFNANRINLDGPKEGAAQGENS